jgi:hypothetical protein
LQSSSHDSDIEVIRAGLKSRDKRHFANACELLSMISHGKLTSSLLQVFEDVGDRKSLNKEESFQSVGDILQWIIEGTDPWLKECVAYINSKSSSKCDA